MKPTEVSALIEKLQATGTHRTLYLMSSPGAGKTTIAAAAAEKLGIGLRVIHAPLMQPEDYGMPIVSKGAVSFAVPEEKFPLKGSECEENGILLIDELPQADHSSQKILANLCQAREIHGKKLKDGWSIIATGNLSTDRAGSGAILSHLRDRVCEVMLDVSLDDWCAWALDNNVSTELVSFLRFRPALLHAFDPQAKSATPRSWVEGVDAAFRGGYLSFEVAKGNVGEGPAAEYLAFLQVHKDLPSPDACLLDPKKAQLPKEPASKYAMIGAITARTTANNFGRALTYVERIGEEFTVMFIRDASRIKGITATREFQAWTVKNGTKLL